MKLKLFISSVFFSVWVQAQVPNVSWNTVASGFSNISGIYNCGDDRLFILEQAGRIRQYNIVTNQTSLFLDMTSLTTFNGERGLLGLAFHPNYQQNGYFYVNYTNPNGSSSFISRFSVDPNNPNQALLSSRVDILSFAQPFSNHNGGDLAFGPDGYLYIATGDGGSGGDPQNNSQNRNNLLGKLLRIDVDNPQSPNNYGIPASNPFVGQANVRTEIWSYGLRNPWRISFDRLTGDLWNADVGQNMWEEVNVQLASSTGGENYGWRCYEGNVTYNMSQCAGVTGLTYPVFVYDHSQSNCSVTGGYVYRGAVFNQVYGRYFLADYCSGRIWSLYPNGNGYTADVHGNVSNAFYAAFGEDRYGELYIGRRSDGTLRKMSVADCIPVAQLSAGSSLTICQGDSVRLNALFNPSLTYTFYKNNEVVSQNQSGFYFAKESGTYKVVVSSGPGCENTSDSLTVSVVDPVIGLSITTTDTLICLNDINLPIQLTASIEGGTFSGNGVLDNLFVPEVAGIGNHIVSYQYLSPQGCIATVQKTFHVNPIPVIEFQNLPNPLILTNPDGELITVTATPAGGSFSGGAAISPSGVINTALLNSLPNGSTIFVSYLVTVDGCTSEAQVPVTVLNQLSIEEAEKKAFLIYPNPAFDGVYIQALNSFDGEIIMEINDLSGKTMLSQVLTTSNNWISLQNVSNGCYVVILKTRNRPNIHRKLIIQK